MFDWDRWVGTVEVVQVDVIDPQSRQGLVEGLVDVLRVSLHESTWFSMGETKLGGEEDLIALSCPLELTLRKPRVTAVSGTRIYGRGMHTILQLDLRCRYRRLQCPRRYTRIRRRHPESVVRGVNQPPERWRA